MADTAYLDGLRMLARRELSEAQVRQRLVRRGHDDEAIQRALERLRTDGSIDDIRAAGAIARTEATVKRRGRLRIRQRLAAAGITGSIADRALDEALAGVDVEAQIGALLDRRLRGRDRIADDTEFARLYRYLIGHGFDSDIVVRLLRARYPRS